MCIIIMLSSENTCGVNEMADVAERVRLGWLMDVYGPMLTEHRRQVMRLYCEEDLSFAEIAEDLQITRQGVGDAVNKARAQLEDYEEKLGLAESERRYREAIEKGIELLKNGETEAAAGILENILKER